MKVSGLMVGFFFISSLFISSKGPLCTVVSLQHPILSNKSLGLFAGLFARGLYCGVFPFPQLFETISILLL